MDADAARLRDDYLARLDEAMSGVPHGIAVDIRQGVWEELTGRDREETAARIAQLGDPADIAREAQREVPGVPVSSPAPSVLSSRGFAIAAALTLSFGGIVVPVVGWGVGVVLVCVSPLWRAWEKWTAVLAPVGIAAVSLLVTWSVAALMDGDAQTGLAAEGHNPLVPTAMEFGTAHSVIIVAFALVPVSGLWLLWRLRGRTRS